ncbi:hypothetical protein [Xanthobacter aminoxidans]|uniref:hypothetical protein n=1 Tax=Xanthobacter aminoxidans TaxID=186280 RepID=UPI003729F87F
MRQYAQQTSAASGNKHALALLFSAVTLTFCILISDFSNQISFLNYILLCLALTITCYFAILAAFEPTGTFLTTLYYSYMLYMFIIPGFFQTTNGKFFWYLNYRYTDFSITISAAIVILFVICVERGRHSFHPKGMRLSPSNAPDLPRSLSTPQIYRIALYSLLLALGAMAYLIARNGISFFFMTRGSISAEATVNLSSTDIGLLIAAPRYICLLAILTTAILLRRTLKSGGQPLIPFIFLGIAIVINALVNNPISVSRGQFMIEIFFLITTLLPPRSVRTRLYIFAIFPLALYMLLPAITKFNRLKNIELDFHFLSLTEALAHGDFDGFQSVLNVVSYVSEQGLYYGKQISSSIFVFIPRSIWPWKGTPTGVDAAEYVGYFFTNVSSPLPVEFYVDFSFFGVVFFSYLFGFCLKLLEARLFQFYQYGLIITTTYIAAAITGLMFVFMRGALLSAMSAVTLFVLAIYLISYVARRVL